MTWSLSAFNIKLKWKHYSSLLMRRSYWILIFTLVPLEIDTRNILWEMIYFPYIPMLYWNWYWLERWRFPGEYPDLTISCVFRSRGGIYNFWVFEFFEFYNYCCSFFKATTLIKVTMISYSSLKQAKTREVWCHSSAKSS